MNLETFVADYGLLAIAVGCYLEGETVLLLGGLGAQQGWLPLPGVIAAGLLGAVFGDQLYFQLGRRLGAPAIAARPQVQRLVGPVSRWIDERGTWFLVGFRFLYGMRIVSPLLLGTSRVSALRFTTWNLLGAAGWASLVASVGFLLGDRVRDGAGVIQAVSVLLLVAVALWWWRRPATGGTGERVDE